MKIKNGEIIPAVGISNIKLNISKKELLNLIGNDYKEHFERDNCFIEVENAEILITNDGKVDQIIVHRDFKGKYKGVIGLGSTLKDVKALVGNYVEVYDTYEMEEDEGICFELEDIDEWDELKAPIEYISVFRV